MPYTPIVATLGYVLSPDGKHVLMVHRNKRDDDDHLGKYNGLGGKLEDDEVQWVRPRGNTRLTIVSIRYETGDGDD